MITYLQAIIIGLLQGITELFPISSLGHSVIVAWLFGWHNILIDQSKSESFFLSFLVILHVATALGLILFYRHTWWRIVKGFFGSLQRREIHNADARLAWLLVVATIPAGLIGLAFEHVLRVQFAKPLSAIIFLIINGFILLAGDHFMSAHPAGRQPKNVIQTTEQVSRKLTFGRAVIIGVAQIGALFAGISRSGITMVSGLYSGLDREDAARFSFLLATPIIMAAGLLKVPDFFNKQLIGNAQGPILAGGVATVIAAYVAVRYLDKYFQDKTLRPFGFYCIGFGIVMLLVGLARGGF